MPSRGVTPGGLRSARRPGLVFPRAVAAGTRIGVLSGQIRIASSEEPVCRWSVAGPFSGQSEAGPAVSKGRTARDVWARLPGVPSDCDQWHSTTMRDPDDIAWAQLRRALFALCIREHGATLMERLRALPELCAPARETEEVSAWVDILLRDLEGRILAGRVSDGGYGSRAGDVAAAMVGLFAEPDRLAQKLRRSRHQICAAAADGDYQGAEKVLWKSLKDHLFDARAAMSPSTTRFRNWQKMEREIRSIRSDWQGESGVTEGPVAPRRRPDDCDLLAVELLRRSRDAGHPFSMDDVSTLDGVKEYLWRFMPECWVDDLDLDDRLPRDELDIAPEPADLWEVLRFCLGHAELPPKQRQAIVDEFLSDRQPDMTPQERKLHLKALRAAMPKLRPCLRRYVDDGLGEDGGAT